MNLDKPFRLHEWRVHPTRHRLEGPGGEQSVEPRVFQLLLKLAERPGEVFRREELLDSVWADTVVNEETLTRAVSELRRIFEDDAHEPRFIETIRKGGYRLVAPVSPDRPETPSPVSGRRRWLWPAVALGVALVLWWQPWKQPAPPPAPVFLDPVPLTSLPGEESHPAISPDGTRVVFSWDGQGDEVDLYLQQPGGGTPLRLEHPGGWDGNAAWSPDGSELAYLHATDSTLAIYRRPATGGAPVKVHDAEGWVPGLCWGPEGRRLLISEGRPFRLRALDLASGERRELTAPAADAGGDAYPRLSPDKRTVAFIRVDAAGQQDVWTIPLHGGEPTRITQALLQVRGLAWAPDGRSLLCSAYGAGTYGLWRVDVESHERMWVPVRGEWVLAPSVSFESGRMVYQDTWFVKNVWRIDRGESPGEGQSTAPLIESTRWDCEAYYSADGQRLAFTSSRSGNLEIWTCRADGSEPVQLTHFDGVLLGNPRWSPDGRSIAFHANVGGRSCLHRIDAEGGPARCLTRGTASELMASWSRDGRWIYHASDRSGRWELWKLRPDGSDLRQITHGGAVNGFESPDGRWLYWVRPHEPGLWGMDLARDEPFEAKLHDSFPARGDWGNWAVGPDGIYGVVRGGEDVGIVRLDVLSAAIEPLARVPNVAAPSLTVSPDGRFLLYARVERSVSDLMLVEDFR